MTPAQLDKGEPARACGADSAGVRIETATRGAIETASLLIGRGAQRAAPRPFARSLPPRPPSMLEVARRAGRRCSRCRTVPVVAYRGRDTYHCARCYRIGSR